MNQWIDIHSHILPAVDNGSVSMGQTIKMLEIAYEEGISHIIATPHYGVGCHNPDQKILEQKLKLVQEEAEKIDAEFTIGLGNEVFYSEDIINDLRKNKALTLSGTRYVLVEFSTSEEFKGLKTGLHRLLIYGYLPILSHVEQYECLYKNYEGIFDLIRLGAYIQMNASGLIGSRFSRKTSFCKKLLEYDLVHLLGSDSHSDEYRSPRMKEALAYIYKNYGEESVNRILIDNPRKLLENQFI